MSLRERILAKRPNIKTEIVRSEAWDENIEIREMTYANRTAFVKAAKKNDENTGLQILILCIFDPETGEQIFGDENIPFLQEHSSKLMDELGRKVLELSGIDLEKEIKEQEKN